MLRKIAVAVIATTMLVAPALAADAAKSAPAITKTDVVATPTVKTDKPVKTDKDVKTVKADKDVKIVKTVAVTSHRHHRHHWVMARHHQYKGHVMTAKISKPVKHAHVIKTVKRVTNVVKTSKAPASKPGSQS
jgi:hypothetical protein